MQQSWRDTPKLQSCLSENLQICASVNNLSQQAQVTLTREHQVAVPQSPQIVSEIVQPTDILSRTGKRQAYSSIAKKSLYTSIILSPEEFESLRFFLPVFDSFYQYHLYVSNRPSGPKRYVTRTTAASAAATTQPESNLGSSNTSTV